MKNESSMIDGVIRLMLKVEEAVEFRCENKAVGK